VSGRMVSVTEARNLSSLAKRDQILHPEVVVPDLAHTVVVQAEQIAALGEAIKDLCWKATQYGETADGDTFAYILPKGTVHRLIGAAQSAGIPAVFRNAEVEA